MTTPLHISSLIKYENILALIGKIIKPNLPTIFTCPFCGKNAYIYGDNMYQAWISCYACGFYGDVIELFVKHKFNINPDTPILYEQYFAAINELVSLNVLKHDAKAIQEYFTEYTRRLNMTLKILNFQNSVIYNDSDVAKVMSQFSLSGIPEIKCRNIFGISRVANNLSLTVPLFDMPGRPLANWYIHQRANKIKHLTTGPNFVTSCFGYLSSLGNATKHVYITSNPMLALLLQYKHALEGGMTLLPILPYVAQGAVNWDLFNGLTPIFIESQLSTSVLEFAANVKNTQLFIDTGLVEHYRKMYQYLVTKPVGEYLAEVRSRAVPVATYCKDKLLNAYDPAVLKLLQHTEYGTSIVDRIFTGTKLLKKEKKKLMIVTGAAKQLKVTLDGNTYVDRDDGIYLVKKEPVKISNFKFVPERIVYKQDSSKQCYGILTFENRSIEFSENVDILRSNFKTWVEDKLMREGLGIPYIADKHSVNFVDICFQLYRPVIQNEIAYIGWANLRWEFPAFTLAQGTVDKREAPAQTVPCAAFNGDRATATELQLFDEGSYGIDGAGLFTYLVYCLLGDVYKYRIDPLLVAKPYNSNAQTLTRFINDCGLTTHTWKESARPEVLTGLVKSTGCPLTLNRPDNYAADAMLKTWLASDTLYKTITLCAPAVAMTALMRCANVIALLANDTVTSVLPYGRLLTSFLSYFSKNEPAPITFSPVVMIQNYIKAWLISEGYTAQWYDKASEYLITAATPKYVIAGILRYCTYLAAAFDPELLVFNDMHVNINTRSLASLFNKFHGFHVTAGRLNTYIAQHTVCEVTSETLKIERQLWQTVTAELQPVTRPVRHSSLDLAFAQLPSLL